MMMTPAKQIGVAILLLLTIIAIGTSGYYWIEHWPLLDCFYMTLITISTIGYGEVHALSYYGRIFTSFLIIVGVGNMGYALGTITQFLLEGQIHSVLGKYKMEKVIQKMADHFIVCGYGSIGKQVCNELQLRKLQVVVIEHQGERAELAQREQLFCLHDDATDEDVLVQAGVANARGLVGTIGSDASNVFITLSGKVLNPKLFVVVRAEKPSSEKKLLRAGADRVISPDLIGGRKMALAAMRPNIVEFMDIVNLGAPTGYRIDQIIVRAGAFITGKSLRESNIRQETGVMIIGIKKNDGRLAFNPSADMQIEDNDILIALGDSQQLKQLLRLSSNGEELPF